MVKKEKGYLVEVISWDLSSNFVLQIPAGLKAYFSYFKVFVYDNFGGKHIIGHKVVNGSVVFSLGDLSFPVDELNVIRCQGGNSELIFCLDGLFPNDDKEYEEKFIRKKQRHGSSFVDFFVADQIDRFFSGSACHYISSAVVKSYKSVEIGSRQYLESSETSLKKAIGRLDEVSVDWHPRKNKEHLYLSLLCALWHVRLANDDFSGFLSALEEAYAHLLGDELTSYFTPAYPGIISLCLFSLFFRLTEDYGKSKRIASSCFDVFQKCVRDADKRKMTLFEEVAVSHRATSKALRIANNKEPLDEEFIKNAFLGSLRINKKEFNVVCENLFESFMKGVKLKSGRGYVS